MRNLLLQLLSENKRAGRVSETKVVASADGNEVVIYLYDPIFSDRATADYFGCVCAQARSAFALAITMALLAGCATQVQQVKVPVPVECRAMSPTRPAMPTEALAPGVDLDRYVGASQAEIEVREGYEIELRAALSKCMAPLDQNSR